MDNDNASNNVVKNSVFIFLFFIEIQISEVKKTKTFTYVDTSKKNVYNLILLIKQIRDC